MRVVRPLGRRGIATGTPCLISDRLEADLVEAMRSREQFRVDALRSLRSRLTYAAKAPGAIKGAEKEDVTVIKIIRLAIGECQKTITEVGTLAGGQKLVDDAKREIALLQGYLPEQLGAEDIRGIVLRLKDSTGFSDMKRLYAAVMSEIGSSAADGKVVSGIVREILASTVSTSRNAQ